MGRPDLSLNLVEQVLFQLYSVHLLLCLLQQLGVFFLFLFNIEVTLVSANRFCHKMKERITYMACLLFLCLNLVEWLMQRKPQKRHLRSTRKIHGHIMRLVSCIEERGIAFIVSAKVSHCLNAALPCLSVSMSFQGSSGIHGRMLKVMEFFVIIYVRINFKDFVISF